ncbi:MAG: DUF1269 domain-containing protein [Oscillatoria sp. PMC 1068.18]|nr:DUF1269 domain-containing protein [Oscillatoria sp. PMC 1076.18]MEC4987930.1 DUF1269 domain-containing protein [Oscillatoria sp. PMC 1068.18]
MVREREIREEQVRTVPQTGSYKRAVGVFKKRSDIEDVIRDIKGAGFDMERVSILARNLEDVEGSKEITETHGNEAKEGAGIGATTGTVLGGIGGFLVGVGLLAIPGIGPILAAGAEISALASTLAGAGIGAASGGIIGALVGLGIPEEKAKIYEDRVKAGDYLIMVSGTDNDINRVRDLMRKRHVEDFDIFDASQHRVDTTSTTATATPTTNVKRMETHEEVVTKDVKTHDLTGDGEAEVVIVDKRKEVR